MQKLLTQKAKEKERKWGKQHAIESGEKARVNTKVGLKLRARVLTYGPGKGACILRLTLQSVPLERQKPKVERNANEQIFTPPPPLRPPNRRKKQKRAQYIQPAAHRTHVRIHICRYIYFIYIYIYIDRSLSPLVDRSLWHWGWNSRTLNVASLSPA